MPELTEVEIPDSISEYLEPVPGESATGTDAANDPEYFKLNMEIPKAIPDYKKWIELSSLILKEKSKDLRAAAYFSFALYRTEGIKGLNQGLSILVHLIKKYGAALFPVNPAHKTKALQFLSGSRVTKFLEKEQLDKNTFADLIDTQKLLDDLSLECKTLIPGNEQLFKSLNDAVSELIQSSQILNTPLQAEEKSETPPAVINKEPVQQPVMVKPEPEKKPAVQPVQTPPALTSEKDITAQIRKSISLMFEYEEEGQKKQRVPEFWQIFNLSRIIQWSNIPRPVDNNGVTLIEAPNKVIQGLIKDWFAKNNTELLIARVESEFIKENGEFRYWLDAQRFIVLSLESKGGNYKTAADDIRHQLSNLLSRMSDLPQLKFKDKQTPFADPETTKWLNDEVINKTVSTNGKNTGGSSMIIVDEKFSDINEEYEKVLNEPPENFEKNLIKMQNDMNNDERIKGKFLRRLNITDYCFRHNEFNLARVMSLELKETINRLDLSKWEPALCASSWQLHYKINKEIISHNKDETLIKKLSAEQEELFYELAKYNGIMALKLINQKR